MNNNGYYFTAAIAARLLDALERGESSVNLSLDLNLSRATFALDEAGLRLDANNRLGRAELQGMAGKANRIFFLADGNLEVLEVREGGYAKLVPTEQAPLLELSGVKMHISKGINPFASAGRMAAQVVKKGDRVLDTCGGLGYAASAALELGAQEVISVERSAPVIALRQRNPWSRRIFGPGIRLVQDDIARYIKGLAAESFDAVIHDPPRLSLAGELYGEAFYRELYRVLKQRGAVFHYTGNPHLVRHGRGFIDQAAQRLRAAGFRRVEKVVELMGVTARK